MLTQNHVIRRLVSFLLMFAVLALLFSYAGVVAVRADNVWSVGNIVGLCHNTPIREGSGLAYRIHTYALKTAGP